MEKKTCIAMVPCPGQGHLIPQVEFAKRLLHQHSEFHVTFLVPTLGPPKSSTMSTLNSLPPNIDFTILPEVNVEDLPHHPVPQMIHTVKLSLPSLHKAISSLSCRTRLIALVFDFFSVDVLDFAKEFNLSSYVLFASGAAALSFSFGFPKFDESVSSHEEFLELSKTMDVPGFATPLQVRDLPDPILFARSGEIYKSYLSALQRLPLVDGVLVNTFTDLEVDSMKALQQRNNNGNSPSVYAIGPIIQAKKTPSQLSHELECVTWLDNQPPNSVLYISFGSGGTLTQDQLNEIAFGLELSGHKFLWVVRAPSNCANADYILGQKGDPLIHLPLGLLERTKGQGLVVPNWAPQIEILAHGSTGGFLSHCGWSSTLESVVHGVPVIAWPLFAEQRMNAILLEDVLKVAVRPSVDDTSGIVKQHEVASVVKRVMEGVGEGLEMRKRMKQLSDAAVAALGEDGSSTKALSTFAKKVMARDTN